MRTGAIFARGSCRALKWAAVLGVAFVFGAGTAAAQITAKVSNGGRVTEEGIATISFEAKVTYPVGAVDAGMITVTATAAAEDAAGTTHEATDISLNPNTTTLSYKAITAEATKRTATLTGSLRVNTVHDNDAEDEMLSFTFSIDLGGVGFEDQTATPVALAFAANYSVALTIDDNEEQKYVLALAPPTQKPVEAGNSITVSVKAMPAHEDDKATVRLHVDNPAYTLGANTVDIGNTSDDSAVATVAENMVTATISVPEDDGNRTKDTIMLRVFWGANTEGEALTISVADANPLPGIAAMVVDDKGKALDPQPTSAMEGSTIKIKLVPYGADDKNMVAIAAAEKLSVSLAPTGGATMQDYRLSTHPITIAKGSKASEAVSLEVVKDDILDPEMLTFNATVSGDAKIGSETLTSTGILSLSIQDATPKLVWAKNQDEVEAAIYAAKNEGMGEDGMFNPGDMIEVMGSALFNAAEGVTLSYTATSDSTSASASSGGGNVMVKAGDMPGEANITITAHASMPAGVKILDQTDPREASIMFPVMVSLSNLSYSVMDPEDMNLVEGGDGAMVKVMASRALAGDETAKIMLMRDGSSSASMDDFMVEPEMVMLKAGDEMAEFMVMAKADDMMENEGNMAEMLTLFVVVDDMQMSDKSVMFYIWDAAVPALPIIAQLLLGGLLAVGGFRRYRRR
jgi:hypothetical protein